MKFQRFLIAFLSLLFIPNTIADERHLQDLREKFPYGLLGDDFGILNMNDLAINACATIKPAPFEQRPNFSYPYWQCFETKKSRLICDGYVYNEDEKMFLSLIVIIGIKDGDKHEYLSRKAIPFEVCKSFRDSWHRFTQNEKYACVSGINMSESTRKNGEVVSVWIFDKFKTKKGCDSYFSGSCSKKKYSKNTFKCSK